MSTYLKNMAGYKHGQLKSKSYDEIQEMFDKEMKRVNTYSELMKGSKTKEEGSSKRAGNELEQEKTKKQKGDDDQKEAEMKRHIEIVKDDEVAIDAIPLATKPLLWERTRLRLFQFSLHDQASNWLERLPAGSISTWEDLTTRFLAQFFPPGRTAKLRNDILMFQQHQGESLSEAWTRFKDLLKKVPYYGIDLWLQVQIFYDHVNPVIRRTINQSAAGKLRDRNAKESWALLEDLALYDNESWNDSRDFTKPVKVISLPQDVPRTSDRCIIELENQVKRLMEAHLALTQPTQKAISEKLDDAPIRDTTGNPASQMNFTSTNDLTRKELCGKGIKSPSKLLSLKYLSQSSLAKQNRNPLFPKCVHFVNSIVILNKEDEIKEEGNVKTSTTEYKDYEMTVESEEEFEEETEDEIEEEEEDRSKHFDTFPTMKELRYHEWLLKNPRPPWVKAKVRTENLNNIKFSCMIGHFDKKQAYPDMESPINVMSRLHYNWIMSKRMGPRRKPPNPGKIYNFVRRVKGLKVFVGNFTYEFDFIVL
ncbi:MAK10-like protein [Tanacetum coccineum]